MDTTTPTPADIDIFDLLNGTSYPTRDITIYTDTVSASKLRDLKLSGGTGHEEEMGELAQKLKDTSLVFTLQGLEPGLVADLYADKDDDEEVKLHKLTASTIKAVKTGAGANVTTVWNDDAVKALRRKLNVGEFTKLITAVTDANFDSALFDDAVDAGFPGGQPVEAAE